MIEVCRSWGYKEIVLILTKTFFKVLKQLFSFGLGIKFIEMLFFIFWLSYKEAFLTIYNIFFNGQLWVRIEPFKWFFIFGKFGKFGINLFEHII